MIQNVRGAKVEKLASPHQECSMHTFFLISLFLSWCFFFFFRPYIESPLLSSYGTQCPFIGHKRGPFLVSPALSQVLFSPFSYSYYLSLSLFFWGGGLLLLFDPKLLKDKKQSIIYLAISSIQFSNCKFQPVS